MLSGVSKHSDALKFFKNFLKAVSKVAPRLLGGSVDYHAKMMSLITVRCCASNPMLNATNIES